jgi:hypothetical protein
VVALTLCEILVVRKSEIRAKPLRIIVCEESNTVKVEGLQNATIRTYVGISQGMDSTSNRSVCWSIVSADFFIILFNMKLLSSLEHVNRYVTQALLLVSVQKVGTMTDNEIDAVMSSIGVRGPLVMLQISCPLDTRYPFPCCA